MYFQKTKPPPVIVTPEEKAALLSMMYPKNRTKPMNPRKKYVCAVCKSPCDLYGLFFHMKQVSFHVCFTLLKKLSAYLYFSRNLDIKKTSYSHVLRLYYEKMAHFH